MNYQEAVDTLYNLPVYSHVGAGAYKPGLDTTRGLDRAFGYPSTRFPAIHIAGTNGKGSTAHTLASILQEAGYKTGLYTSPHIFDFKERVRVNGKKIDARFVTSFVEEFMAKQLPCQPSFFELTTILAFSYFAAQNVDVAVIETGLGGRLDSTNILTPLLSVITNISMDHMALLGNTLSQIAAEKAGIIKPETPVVIGEADQLEVRKVFEDKAKECGSEIRVASPIPFTVTDSYIDYGFCRGQLMGECQPKNTATVITCMEFLKPRFNRIDDEAVKRGIEHVADNTGLIGRWTPIASHPRIIIDSGHNIGAWQYTAHQLAVTPARQKFLITGFSADKDLEPILPLVAAIPGLTVLATRPSAPRGLAAQELSHELNIHGISCETYANVNDALDDALSQAGADDMILIAGSNFLIADLDLDRYPISC